MRKRLEAIAEATVTLLRVLEADDPPLHYILEDAGPGYIDNVGALVAGLKDIRDRAARAADRISTKGGTGRAWAVPGASSSKDLCAMVVSEAWLLIHRSSLVPSNRVAISAADAYWRACGGGVLSVWKRSGADATGWRKHFLRVGREDRGLERERQAIQRMLSPEFRTANKSRHRSRHRSR
jgi:hypothetical protein